MSRRVAIRAIIVNDEYKLLCVRLKDNYKKGQTITSEIWCTPGGGLDDGELIIPALRREVVEETGIEPKVGRLLYIQQFLHAGNEQMELFFHVTNAEDYTNVDLAKASHGQLEIAEISFIDPAANKVLPKFLTEEPILEHIASHSPVKIFSYL